MGFKLSAHCQTESLTENVAESVGGALYDYWRGTPIFRNCVLWGNEPGEVFLEHPYSGEPLIIYSNVAGGYHGAGNIDADPLHRTRWGHDHLLGSGSPCIDAGDPSVQDRLSDAFPRWPHWCANGPRSDMGAYGGFGNWRWLRNGD